MCDTNDEENGKSSDECVCEESSSGGSSSSSCNCVCIPCEGEKSLCVGINVKGKIEACNDCSCGQEDTTPKSCDNKKCDKKNCICIETRGKPYICVGIDNKGTIMCYSDCTCKNDCKQGPKPKANFAPSGASCICICIDDNRKVTPCFDCSCKQEENKDTVCEGCCCVRQESLPVLAFTEDTAIEVRKAILEDKSTNTSCADCLCEIPKCTSFNCICPPETTTVTVVKKFDETGETHDCNCPEPKGEEKPKCCKE